SRCPAVSGFRRHGGGNGGEGRKPQCLTTRSTGPATPASQRHVVRPARAMGMAGDDRSSRKRDTTKRISAVQDILKRWDPIGVRPGEVAPADEYDGYAPHIVSMVAGGCSIDDL